jgi:hypothetical protein
MNVDESGESEAAFLEYQTVIKNIYSFVSSSLGYIISGEAVDNWRYGQVYYEIDDTLRTSMYLYDFLQDAITRLSVSVEPCCGGTLSGKRTCCWIGGQQRDLCDPSSFDLEVII